MDLEFDQFPAYRRGDRIRVYPLRGRQTFITGRELQAAEPLWRIGHYAFSWQPIAAAAALGFAALFLAIGVLGIKQEFFGLRTGLVFLREGLYLVFGLSVAAMLVPWPLVEVILMGS